MWGAKKHGYDIKIRFLFQSRYLSRFWIFSTQIFIKYLILCQILIIWWKIWVLLTIIFYLKIWLSPGSHGGMCYPYDSHSSTELNSSFSHFLTSNFLETYFLCYILIIYYNFRCGVSRNMGTTSKLGFCYKVDISAVFEFFHLKFS